MSAEFKIIIERPTILPSQIKEQFVKLVTLGGQVKEGYVKVGLHRAELAGVLLINDQLVSSCCLKVPSTDYRNTVFNLSKCSIAPDDFTRELGYIATSPEFDGQGYCQKLLNKFMASSSSPKMFATTRKASIVHILGKFNFEKKGEIFKEDLELLTFQP